MKRFITGAAVGLALLALGACSLLSAISGNAPQDPKSVLAEVQFGAALAETAYEAICPPAGGGPSFCANSAADYQKAKTALDAAIKTAAAAIAASNDASTATVAALLDALQNDWQAYNKIVNTTKAKNAALLGVPYEPIPLRN